MNLNIGNIGVRGRGSPVETSAEGRSADRADRRDLPNKRLTRHAAVFACANTLLVEVCRVFAQANAMLAMQHPCEVSNTSVFGYPNTVLVKVIPPTIATN